MSRMRSTSVSWQMGIKQQACRRTLGSWTSSNKGIIGSGGFLQMKSEQIIQFIVSLKSLLRVWL